MHPALVVVAVITLLTVIEMALILRATGSHLLFTLDDPFIHLSLAERIADGRGYGLNAGEPSAPASSILFPFLLVPLRPLGQVGPLLLTYGAALAAGLLACAILRQAGWAIDRAGFTAQAGLALCFVLATNLLGLIFTGMEHALHLTLTLACVLGAQRFIARQRVEAWWLAAAIASPLIRYEGFSNLLAVALLLAWHRRIAMAGLLVVAGSAGPVLFGVWLYARGLPPLPGSVLVKAAAGIVSQNAGIFGRWWENRYAQYAALPLVLICLALIAAWRQARRRGEPHAAQIAGFGLVIAGLQFFVGRFNGFSRYELYAAGAGLLAAAAGLAPAARTWRIGAARAGAGLALAAVLACFPYVRRAFELPAAASGIYRQQFQMHRFAIQYWRASVAVNDIGLVSYENPNYVLDLWGLGSEAARRVRGEEPGADWMDRLARQSDTGLAMIYPQWFPTLPEGWRLVGMLRLRHGYLVNGGRDVGFYATNAAALPRVEAALREFVPTLPARADFMWKDGGPKL